MSTKCILAKVLVLLCSITLLLASPSHAAFAGEDVTRYAAATWHSIDQMVQPTGLPADGLDRQQDGSWKCRQWTSATNIGCYLWSIIAADSLGLITKEDATSRVTATLTTMERMKKYQGLFYGWYDPCTAEVLLNWPNNPEVRVRQCVSSVDNAWLEVGLRLTGARYPSLLVRCQKLSDAISYSHFLTKDQVPQSSGFHVGIDPETGVLTTSRYGVLNSETRIVTYMALLKNEVSAQFYQELRRTNTALIASAPAGSPSKEIFFPSMGGSMFEALMVPLFVAEDEWSPQRWAPSHRRYVQLQIACGTDELKCGIWGFSPCMAPGGGYQEFGVSSLAIKGAGYSTGKLGPVITPHAVFLALPYAKTQAIYTLNTLEKDYGMWTEYGFLDAVNATTRKTATSILVLDQAMIIAAITNDSRANLMRKLFTTEDAHCLRLQSALKD